MSASDAPQRAPGLRTRSGNAMLRTRAAILDAAASCIERLGVRRTTMGEIAATGGVAKATLYNHFRTKDDVLAALVEARVAQLGSACAELAGRSGLPAALEHAAAELAGSGALRRVAADEPVLLLPLLVPGEGRVWESAQAAASAVLAAAGAAAGQPRVELVLRWLLSQLLWPIGAQDARGTGEALAAALASAAPPRGTSTPRAHPSALGWPA